MNSRERFKAVMKGENVELPLWEYAYWVDTIRNWYADGLTEVYGLPQNLPGGSMVYGESLFWPDEVSTGPRDRDVHAFFGLDEGLIRVPVRSWIWPLFGIEIIKDESDRITMSDQMGIIREVRKDGKSVPRFLKSPVNTQMDFDAIKFRLDPTNKERFPENWKELVKGFNQAQFPVVMGGHPCGFFGSLRYLVGLENLCFMYYDNPSLIHTINQHLCNLWITVWGKALSDVKVDCVHMWEDMSYTGGSLISPAAFREFMMPYYKRVVRMIKDCGVEFIWVDTDGDCNELIPLFMECGITGMYPFEVQSIDIVEVRKNFPSLEIMGGVSLEKETPGPELEKKLQWLIKSGRYIPCADNIILPDISWHDFRDYRWMVEKLSKSVFSSLNGRHNQ